MHLPVRIVHARAVFLVKDIYLRGRYHRNIEQKIYRKVTQGP